MQCPACDASLSRVVYENHPVFRCDACGGYLVAKRRVKLIKSSREQSTDALEQERTERQADTEARLSCPKCRARIMSKEKIPIREPGGEFFHVDTCRHCGVVWFDAGELAQLQLDYESSPKAADELERRRRLEGLSDEQRDRLQQDMAVLRRSENFLEAAVSGIPPIFLMAASAAVTLLCFLVGGPGWINVAAGLAFGLGLGWLIVANIGINGRSLLLAALAVLVFEAFWLGLVLDAFSFRQVPP